MRIWKNENVPHYRTACIGNGRCACYITGLNIDQVFGPVYSCANYFKMNLVIQGDTEIRSVHLPSCAVWRHEVYRNGDYIGLVEDYADTGKNLIVRKFELKEPIKFTVIPGAAEDLGGGLYFLDCDAKAYNGYPANEEFYLRLFYSNGFQDKGEITLNGGTGYMLFSFGRSREDCLKEAEGFDIKNSLQSTKDYWRTFFFSSEDIETLPDYRHKETVLELYENVLLAVKTQQTFDGSFIAGSRYHLCYVRDQYGVSRFLLAAGLYDDAKKLLQFYFNIFKRYGYIKNAMSSGLKEVIFHCHENDEVELTGYIILQAFDYAKASGDYNFLRQIKPMLVWALKAQNENLHNGMLPFNGDETYIAGWILPRTCMDDGSAESTFLYILSSEKMLEFFEDLPGSFKENCQSAKASFYDNFFIKGKPVVNNPSRRRGLRYKEERSGVCESCGSYGRIFNKGEYYVCEKCKPKSFAKKDGELFTVRAALLTYLYLDNDFFSLEEKKNIYGYILDEPDSSEIRVGFEPGMFLKAALAAEEDGEEHMEELLKLIDDTGVFSEYYRDGKPFNCDYRPWESSINMEAAMSYLKYLRDAPEEEY